MTPVIGITTYEDQASWRGWSARAAMLPYVYVDAVRRSGARAILLPPGGDDEEASDTVAGLDGLVVSGGPDIDPVRYGASRHPRTQAPTTLRDAWDLSVTGHALRLGVPLLAICRGMQVLNVCRGGTLHQHLPDITDGSIEHRQRDSGTHPTHAARIERGSRVGEVLGLTDTRVNSFHHQGMNELGEGLRAVAWAPDGVIEAIEARSARYVVGVQWHAEGLVDLDGGHARLFPSFVAAARDHATVRERQTA